LLDSGGRLVGTGSLYIEAAVPGEASSPGNMFVPIDLLAPIRRSMETTGRSGREARPWLGMHTAEAEERLVVTGVAPGAPADRGGVRPGDIVLGVDGVAVKDLAHMYRTVWASGPVGGEIRFTLLRDDDVITLRIRAGDRYDFLDLPRRH
jgi:S1-C subfamily serine protease